MRSCRGDFGDSWSGFGPLAGLGAGGAGGLRGSKFGEVLAGSVKIFKIKNIILSY